MGDPKEFLREGVEDDIFQNRVSNQGQCLLTSWTACISHKCYLSLSTIRRTDASHGADAEDGDSTRNLVEFLQADGEERRILLCLARLKSVPFMLMAIFSREDHEGGYKFVVAVLFVLIHRIHPGAW